MSIHKIPRVSGSPYTIRITRTLADHTGIDCSFIEPDDARFSERFDMIVAAFNKVMVETNEKIMLSTDRINAAVDAVLAERTKLNGGADGGPSRPAHVPADS